jgi:DNA-binding XRE family transcriptional regulator
MGEMDGQSTRTNRVREFRENKLMTQAQLARKAKVALRTIHSVEKGMNCRMDTKRKILLALGMRFEDKDLVFPPTHRLPMPTPTAAPTAAPQAPSSPTNPDPDSPFSH